MPCERGREGYTREDLHVTVEAEAGVMPPQKECQPPPEDGGKEHVLPRTSEGTWPCQHSGFDPVKLVSDF